MKYYIISLNNEGVSYFFQTPSILLSLPPSDSDIQACTNYKSGFQVQNVKI